MEGVGWALQQAETPLSVCEALQGICKLRAQPCSSVPNFLTSCVAHP